MKQLSQGNEIIKEDLYGTQAVCTKFAGMVREATENRKQGAACLLTFEGNIPDKEGCEGGSTPN